MNPFSQSYFPMIQDITFRQYSYTPPFEISRRVASLPRWIYLTLFAVIKYKVFEISSAYKLVLCPSGWMPVPHDDGHGFDSRRRLCQNFIFSYSQFIHSLFPFYSHDIHILFTFYSHSIHMIFTFYSHDIHILFTWYSGGIVTYLFYISRLDKNTGRIGRIGRVLFQTFILNEK